MALTKCKECGSDVAEMAAKCPRCGNEHPSTDMFSKVLVTLAVLGAFVGLIVWWASW